MNNHAKDPIVHTKLQSSITPRKKRNSKKSFYFWILRWTSFLMIPLTFLYDEYIDRPKFTEQKKKPIWVYSSFPHKWGRNKYRRQGSGFIIFGSTNTHLKQSRQMIMALIFTAFQLNNSRQTTSKFFLTLSLSSEVWSSYCASLCIFTFRRGVMVFFFFFWQVREQIDRMFRRWKKWNKVLLVNMFGRASKKERFSA